MKTLTVNLSSTDLGQTLDALESRAEAYEQTARYHQGEVDFEDDENPTPIEEVTDAEEADHLASEFRRIAEHIRSQISA